MVLTAQNVTTFFTGVDYLELDAATVSQLQVEGISTPNHLVEFDKDALKQLADNLRNPGGRVVNPDPNAPEGSTIPRPPYIFGAKSQKRLLACRNAVCFYDSIDRPLSLSMLKYDPVIKNFELQWKALSERRDEELADVPKVTKALPIISWIEAFADHLSNRIGTRMIPLSYVIRENANPPAVPPLAVGKPHSSEYGSVEADMVALSSHNHPLYRDDNAQVYFALEQGLRGTSYLSSIKPFQRTRNGREAYFSVQRQYAGEDKWNAEIRKQEEVTHNRVWKGQGQYTLERYVAQHRNAYVMLHECALHVDYQLPNQRTRVTHLLDNISCEYAPLQAAMALCRNDTAPNGKMNDFEATASFIIPHDPVAKKQASQKRPHAQISEAEGSDSKRDAKVVRIADVSTKKSIGKTGVELRFYKRDEYKKLSKEQKDELYQWRQQQKEKKNQAAGNKSIAAAVAKELAKQKEADSKAQKIDEEFSNYVMSLVTSAKEKANNAKVSGVQQKPKEEDSAPKVSINSILRRANLS